MKKKTVSKSKKSSAKSSVVKSARSAKSGEKSLFEKHQHLKKLLALLGASSVAAVYILSH